MSCAGVPTRNIETEEFVLVEWWWNSRNALAVGCFSLESVTNGLVCRWLSGVVCTTGYLLWEGSIMGGVCMGCILFGVIGLSLHMMWGCAACMVAASTASLGW